MNFTLTLRWLARWKILWWFLVAIIGSVIVADWLGCRAGIARDDRLPYAGWFLEMLGVLVVFIGIAEKLALFEKDGLLARTLKLLREFPLFRRNVHVAVGSARLNLQGARARHGQPKKWGEYRRTLSILRKPHEQSLQLASGRQRRDGGQVRRITEKIRFGG